MWAMLTKRLIAFTFLCLVVASVVGACGGAAPPAASKAAAPASGQAASPATALDALYQQAKTEGQVNWNSSSAEAIVAQTIQAFEKKYPGVKINYTAKPAPQVLTDVQVQQAAHKVEIDVAQSADLNITDTLAGHLPAAVDWAKLGVPADRVFEGTLVNYTDAPFIFVYNKDKVPADQAPKTWDDLINPRWQGNMVLDGRGTFLASFIAAPETGGASKGLDLAKKLEAQKPLYQTSFTVIEPMVISGQALVGNDSLSNALAALKKGAPIDIVPISPVYTQRSPAYVPAGAPHMAAAQLLVAWLASPEGQTMVAAQGAGAATTCSDAELQLPAAQAMCSRHMRPAFFKSLDQFQQLSDYLTQVQKTFGTYTGK
jgi:iron(III) transport system substrate-binding protein